MPAAVFGPHPANLCLPPFVLGTGRPIAPGALGPLSAQRQAEPRTAALSGAASKKGGHPLAILLTGATHTGKTVLSQRLMERLAIPYFSLDHLKMGLIRSGYTALTPCQDDALCSLLWPIARVMAKTVVENRQSLILEGA